MCVEYSSNVRPAINKANTVSSHWPVLLSHIIFSTANWEGGGQSSMNLTKFYPEITLPVEDCVNYRIKKLDT